MENGKAGTFALPMSVMVLFYPVLLPSSVATSLEAFER